MCKKLLVFLGIVIIICGLSACKINNQSNTEEETVVMFLAGAGKIDDGSFNNGILSGLKKGAKELKYDLKVLASENQSDYEKNIKAAIDAKPQLIIGGSDLTDPILNAAKENANINFAVIDSTIEETMDNQLPKNVAAFNFKNAEGAFLMGVLAATANSQSSVEGFIGGIDLPIIKEAEIGYKAGIAAVSPEARVLVSSVGDFESKEKAFGLSEIQNSEGAGVVFGFAGGANKGILENAAKNNYWFIGVDQDQALQYPSLASSVLCSMVKNLDRVSYALVKMQMDGQFTSGIQTFGVKDGSISLGSGGGNITPELQVVYNKWHDAISSGEVKVPKTQKELDSFKQFE